MQFDGDRRWTRRESLLSSVGMIYRRTLTLEIRGKGIYEINDDVVQVVPASGVGDGIVTIFNKHTSSLVLMENAEPSARTDLEGYFDRLVPENADYFIHTCEDSDDMPSHIRMALTRSSETIPVDKGRVMLGTWQGLFVFEHRRAVHSREIVVTVLG